MSVQRRRSSVLANARYNPLSQILSPVLSLTRLIRRTYRPEREATGSSVSLIPTPSIVAGSNHLDGINQGNAPIVAPNRFSHLAVYEFDHGRLWLNAVGTKAFLDSKGGADGGEGGHGSKGNESDDTSDSDYVQPSSSDPSVSTDVTSSIPSVGADGSVVQPLSASAESASAEIVARTSASMAPCSTTRQRCANWAEDAGTHVGLEPGEIFEVPEIAARSGSSLSQAPSELIVAQPIQRIRFYEFRDLYLGGRLHFEPRLPGPPGVNRWLYRPVMHGLEANTERAIGDIDFSPLPGGGFQYFVYCEAPGTNDYLEYCWVPLQLGGPHPHHTSYVLYHLLDFAPLWLHQPSGDELNGHIAAPNNLA
ncbi:hypothetical protein FRC12_003286 [Ceratobasidium sp. 428]|nr:hypothetical protein FRC12_003286 [Ceratobasidium sp. 428]